MRKFILELSILFFALLPAVNVAQESEYRPITAEALRTSPAGSAIGFKILVDAANLGSEETRIAELSFPVGYEGQSHLHDAVEIFYVLSGHFGHKVNDVSGVLAPGNIGIVKPGDTVAHSVVGDEPVVVLTIWIPGGVTAPLHSQ